MGFMGLGVFVGLAFAGFQVERLRAFAPRVIRLFDLDGSAVLLQLMGGRVSCSVVFMLRTRSEARFFVVSSETSFWHVHTDCAWRTGVFWVCKVCQCVYSQEAESCSCGRKVSRFWGDDWHVFLSVSLLLRRFFDCSLC